MCVKKLGRKTITKTEKAYWKVFTKRMYKYSPSMDSLWHGYFWQNGINYANISKQSFLFFNELQGCKKITFDTGFFCFKKEIDAKRYNCIFRANLFVKKVFIPANTKIQHIEDDDNVKCIITPVLILK